MRHESVSFESPKTGFKIEEVKNLKFGFKIPKIYVLNFKIQILDFIVYTLLFFKS